MFQVVPRLLTVGLGGFRVARPMSAYGRILQNGPRSATRSKIASISSIVFRRQSSLSRSTSQIFASSQHCASVITSPRGIPRHPHQRSTCSTDRKSRIVAQVKPMFSQKRRGGTAKWITPSVGTSAPPSIRTVRVASQSEHRVTVWESIPRSAGRFSASQAQFAQ